MVKKFLLFIFILIPITIGSIGYYNLAIWKYNGPNTTFKISEGESFSKINYNLANQGLISSSKVFFRYAKYQDLMTKFKSGTFAIPTGTTMIDIFDILIKGTPLNTKITIPEGKNLFEIANILKQNNIIKSEERFIELAKSPEFVHSLGINANRIEGYLYPDTYFFADYSSEESVIKSMVSNFKKAISQIDLNKTNMNLHQIVTLASIVEKETGARFERPTIAGVFHNRLKKKMRLQSDPTTIYGIYENFDGNLRKHHLQEVTDYNTYKISGLPKGPIANPGIESIKAVVSPDKHNYLYFVSKNDGTHIFSTNYKDHLHAVEEWQKNRANRSGKSWRDLQQ